MADESKRPARSSSTRSAAKGKASSARSKAASSGAETTAEKAAPATSETTTAAQSAPPPPAAAPAAHAAPDPAPASGGGVALAGLLAGLIGIVLALTYPQWTPIVYGSSGGEKSVTADQVRTELSGQITALKATVASMAGRQAELEASVRTAKLPGILMVAEDLRSALGTSEPYSGTLNLFRALTGGDEAAAPIIAAVETQAEVGIPTVKELAGRYDEAAHAVLMAEQPRPATTGDLAAQVSETMASLTAATMRLRWRLDGAPAGDGAAAVVARAEQAIAKGELQVAIDTLGLLPEDRKALVASWIELANARLAAESTREELDGYIISTAARIQ